MPYIGKSIAMLGIMIFILNFLLPVVGINPGKWVIGLGMIIIVIGAITHVAER